MGLQYEGVNTCMLVGDGAKGNGARDVGRPILILRTAVNQHKSMGHYARVACGCRRVVHDGSMRFVGYNRVK